MRREQQTSFFFRQETINVLDVVRDHHSRVPGMKRERENEKRVTTLKEEMMRVKVRDGEDACLTTDSLGFGQEGRDDSRGRKMAKRVKR